MPLRTRSVALVRAAAKQRLLTDKLPSRQAQQLIRLLSTGHESQLNGARPSLLPDESAASTTVLENEFEEDKEETSVRADVDFTGQRLGHTAIAGEQVDFSELREESRADATKKAERVLAILRHSMTEVDVGRIAQRVTQYATYPKVTPVSYKRFLESLQAKFGPAHQKEYEYLLAFLSGKDEVIDELEAESKRAIESLEKVYDQDETPEVPDIMVLHPELARDPTFIGIVICYCRLACLNSLKLMHRQLVSGPARGMKRTTLTQVKSDFRRVLDAEGYGAYAEMMGLDQTQAEDDKSPLDAEWDEFNLENDRIDFRMLLAQTQQLAAQFRTQLDDETITRMLVAMLASVRTSKLHRMIFQEMVSNVQTAFPSELHESVLSRLVPFLSGGNASYEDFESEAAETAVEHHQLRHEAIVRGFLEARMRVGHILIPDLDDIDPETSVSKKLTPIQREQVITTAWNIVSLLDEREYHAFFSRLIRYKLAWRPNKKTFGQTFVEDVRAMLPPLYANVIMPTFEEIYPHLSVETLTICRVRLRHSRKLLREKAEVVAVNDKGRENLAAKWHSDRCVFYRNLPFGVTSQYLQRSLSHIGTVERSFLFSRPRDGAPEQDSGADEGSSIYGVEGLDYESLDGEANSKKRRSTKTPIKKTNVNASDTKTAHEALVEFATVDQRNRALQQSLRIFGVMMSGWKEQRAVFSSLPERRCTISIQSIPFATKMGDLLAQINDILRAEGLEARMSNAVPPGVLVTNGRVEFQFQSFDQAAQVVDGLNNYLKHRKSRRQPTEEEVEFDSAKQRYVRSHPTIPPPQPVGEEEEDDDEEVEFDYKYLQLGTDDEEEVEEEDEPVSRVQDTAATEYFANIIADEASLDPSKQQQARPFDVTWNPTPRPRNKHLYN